MNPLIISIIALSISLISLLLTIANFCIKNRPRIIIYGYDKVYDESNEKKRQLILHVKNVGFFTVKGLKLCIDEKKMKMR